MCVAFLPIANKIVYLTVMSGSIVCLQIICSYRDTCGSKTEKKEKTKHFVEKFILFYHMSGMHTKKKSEWRT